MKTFRWYILTSDRFYIARFLDFFASLFATPLSPSLLSPSLIASSMSLPSLSIHEELAFSDCEEGQETISTDGVVFGMDCVVHHILSLPIPSIPKFLHLLLCFVTTLSHHRLNASERIWIEGVTRWNLKSVCVMYDYFDFLCRRESATNILPSFPKFNATEKEIGEKEDQMKEEEGGLSFLESDAKDIFEVILKLISTSLPTLSHTQLDVIQVDLSVFIKKSTSFLTNVTPVQEFPVISNRSDRFPSLASMIRCISNLWDYFNLADGDLPLDSENMW
jgi:hypothetical protein